MALAVVPPLAHLSCIQVLEVYFLVSVFIFTSRLSTLVAEEELFIVTLIQNTEHGALGLEIISQTSCLVKW